MNLFKKKGKAAAKLEGNCTKVSGNRPKVFIQKAIEFILLK